jgi:hypothetical protein
VRAYAIVGVLAAASLLSSSLAARQSAYFGQPPPGLSPERFAPGVVSTDLVELNGVFAPDMKEFFFARRVDDGVTTMFHSEFVDGAWRAPRELPLFPDKKRALAVDMALSPDGREMYFLSDHPSGVGGSDIWRSRRVNGRWATAEPLPSPVNTPTGEVYPVVVGDGSLYFVSNRPGGEGARNRLYRAQRLEDGSFASPVLVSDISNEFGVGDTFVAPDESYMILTSRRPPSLGAGDLFVSFRLPGGGWGELAHLGKEINSEDTDFCPMVTPDGKYLFFSRRRGTGGATATAGDVYWVDAKILDRFRR